MAWWWLGGPYKSGQSGQSGHIFLADTCFIYPYKGIYIYYKSITPLLYSPPLSFFRFVGKVNKYKSISHILCRVCRVCRLF